MKRVKVQYVTSGGPAEVREFTDDAGYSFQTENAGHFLRAWGGKTTLLIPANHVLSIEAEA